MTLEKEKKAVDILKAFAPSDEAYHLCYSGGKDSDTIRILAAIAGVNFEIHHCLTTMDAPETVQYIKSIPDVHIDLARYKDGSHKTIWNLIPAKRMPPTRVVRYCCSEFKEWGGKGKFKITGVRWAESSNRKKYGGLIRIIGKPKTMQKKASQQNIDFVVTAKNGLILNEINDNNIRFATENYPLVSVSLNPIIDWSDDDVWEFLRYYGCDSNPLYQSGQKRIGCIGCSMARKEQRIADFKNYPAITKSYLKTFEKMIGLQNHPYHKNAVDAMYWWLELNDTEKEAFGSFLAKIGEI